MNVVLLAHLGDSARAGLDLLRALQARGLMPADLAIVDLMAVERGGLRVGRDVFSLYARPDRAEVLDVLEEALDRPDVQATPEDVVLVLGATNTAAAAHLARICPKAAFAMV